MSSPFKKSDETGDNTFQNDFKPDNFFNSSETEINFSNTLIHIKEQSFKNSGDSDTNESCLKFLDQLKLEEKQSKQEILPTPKKKQEISSKKPEDKQNENNNAKNQNILTVEELERDERKSKKCEQQNY